MMGKVQVIAHRGASGIAPENTIIAFKKAIEMGSDAIETDVQMTKDGHLVLIHDEKLERTTNGTGWVKDYTLSELQSLDAGRWFSRSFAGEPIPTVDELLDLIYNTKLWVNIEIKMGFVLYPGIEEKLVEKVREYQLQDRVIISSFNHYSIDLIKKIDPNMETAVLYSEGLYEPWNYAERLGARFLHPSKGVLSREIVMGAHSKGIKVHPYTINDEKGMLKYIKMGVDGIITNFPDKLISILEQTKE